MPCRHANRRRPRPARGWRLGWIAALLAIAGAQPLWAAPHLPASDQQVLAVLPPGATHSSAATRQTALRRLDVALPLAQFYIARARVTGDLRFLGYAESILSPWLQQTPVQPSVLVLDATLQQSRHAFGAALAQLERALAANPQDAQGWLTRATVLRVLGRYDEALAACQRLESSADGAISALCEQSVLGLSGHLAAAYQAVMALPQAALPREVRAWRYSELGEMAERDGEDAAAEHWLREGLQLSPDDLYMRSALADVLLRHARAAETLQLLRGYEAMEPMLLRLAIAHKQLRDGELAPASAMLASAFELEQQRGEAVHRREQARFLLDVESQPQAALAAAQQNWGVQREPDDVLILLRAAQAARQPQAALPALQFVQRQRMQDVRLAPYLQAGS